ncbi:MAG: nitronate monooxygenase [Planctomycetes bacterium]|nr:nitronate monooxygenase [Planctomycetota bacterium]
MLMPEIIQGGMGAGVSDWKLARSVSMKGLLGVVSGTALDLIPVRRLQNGDPGGHMRRALKSFPVTEIADQILEKYYIAGGKAFDAPYKAKPMVGLEQAIELQQLLVAGAFAEVFLAKEGHDGLVGINLMEKLQPPIIPTLYGAMLAGVDVVIVGAGIPVKIPGVIDKLVKNEAAVLPLHVQGASAGTKWVLTFAANKVMPAPLPILKRPKFFPIVSSISLANMLLKKSDGQIDGMIIEASSAGGHNAPPRGKLQLDPQGEPIYGERDEIDLEAFRDLGLPFWLAGSYGTPEQLENARIAGAAGIQVGTLFAFCEESGLREDLKTKFIEMTLSGKHQVFTDPLASPTGFPFKVLSVSGSNSEAEIYDNRGRVCDCGYLREAYELPDGSLGWRCAAEEGESFVRKGGIREDTANRKCLCNGLMANIGLEQIQGNGYRELPLVTCGSDAIDLKKIIPPGKKSYSVEDAIAYLFSLDLEKAPEMVEVD